MRKLGMVAAAGLVTLLGASVEAGDGRKLRAVLSGAEEVPPVQTEASGRLDLKVDKELESVEFKLQVWNGENLLAAAGAHLHCAEAGVNGPVVAFLAGPVAGGFDGELEVEATLTDANITNPLCGATIAELVEAMRDGRVYANVHSAEFPGGVVRGQVAAKGEGSD